MKSLFIDTNVIVDLLADRQPFSTAASAIFALAETKKVKLYTSSHAFATTHYLLKKYIGEAELRIALFELLDLIKIISIDLSIIKKSLLSSHKDLEDAIQIFAANTISEMDYIVTRNIKDFKGTGIDVLTPDAVLAKL